MPIFPRQSKKTLGTGGGTVNINVADIYNEYTYNGSGSLSGSWVFQPSATPTKPTLIRIFYNCQFGLNGQTITFLFSPITVTLNLQQALSGNILIEAIYDPIAAGWIVVVKQSDANLIPNVQGVKTRVIPAGGGTTTLVPGIDSQWQELTLNATLTSSFTITGAESAGYFFVHFTNLGSGLANGNSGTIFGKTLTAAQINNGEVSVFAYYDTVNSEWRSQLVQDPAKQFIPQLLVVPLHVSFAGTGGVSLTQFILPAGNWTVQSYYSCVEVALAGTDVGVVTFLFNGSNPTPYTYSIPASSAAGYIDGTNFTAGNTLAGGNVIQASTTKTTSGGSANIFIYLISTP